MRDKNCFDYANFECRLCFYWNKKLASTRFESLMVHFPDLKFLRDNVVLVDNIIYVIKFYVCF